ncbi:MAG TPA: zf-HC2 domain-containing protein [Gemmatimonadales bacterium]|nr:zf-HC2 domain-containing protein [Gemmatimonadales bacterium]
MTPHLDDGLIHELVDGEVDSSQLGAIQGHLSECASCRARLDDARDAAGFADSLLEMLDPEEAADDPQVIPLPARKPHWSRNLAWAASLILAAGLGYIGRGEFMPPQVQPPGPRAETSVTTSPAAPLATESSAAPAEPSPPAREPEQQRRASAPVIVPPADITADRAELAESREAEVVRTDQPPARGRAASAAAIPANQFEDASISTRAATPEFGLRQITGAPAAAKAAPTATIVVDLPAAMTTLGGSIRLIDGLAPERLERLGDTVMVIYRVLDMTLSLRQYPIGTDLSWSLEAPRQFPADSLAALRARVK